ncbi:MAG: cytochrome c biogenesis protein ResB [Verrucomicrobia bacterium]|nr:cytochrome c biogenesis protein ResB [Verrucomicrobiota bacterium]
MLDRLVRFFTSLKLTVVLLALGTVLVFWGTIAQASLGLYKAQNEFFRSFFVFWQPASGGWRIPIYPGGYMIGGLLLINLFAAHIRYYQPGKRKIGVALIHLGVVLLLVGQFLTDYLSTESSMHIRNGGTKNYSEADRDFELAITDTSEAELDTVVTIPARRLVKLDEIAVPKLPFTLRVKKFFPNSVVTDQPAPMLDPVNTTAGFGGNFRWKELPHETTMSSRDTPAGIVEPVTPQGSLGTFLVSGLLTHPQEFVHDGRKFLMQLRPVRYYKPFSLHLVEFRHDKYAGTDIPKNFSSRVRVENAGNGDSREVLIKMNTPLRYAGDTFYQASFDPDNQGTVLQVVHNPSWLTPYFSCVLVSIGLLIQFLTHLFRFAAKRKTA